MTAYATTTTDTGEVARVEWLNVLADSGDQSVRNHWRWSVESPDSPTIAGEDLTSAMDVLDPDPIEALRSLGAFLSSYSEHLSFWSCDHSDEPCKSGDCPRGMFPGLDGEVAGVVADHIENVMPREFQADDPLLTIHATEVDQDGRGPNEWLVEVADNPDSRAVLLVSTSRPESLLASFRDAGVTVVEHPYVPGWQTVEEKAALARPYVETYRAEHSPGESLETILSDLLADMQHLAYVEGIDWADVERVATRNVEAERAGEDL